MLASLVLHLTPHHRAPVGANPGRSLHGLLYKLLAHADPDVADALHAGDGLKPFTVSPLEGAWERDGQRRIAVPGRAYCVRYTVLSDSLSGVLGGAILEKCLLADDVTIDGNPFAIAQIAVEPAQSAGWACLTTYEDLAAAAATEDRIALHFVSPTTFRTGDVNLLFPLPESVFGSYLRKWNAFAPAALALPDTLPDPFRARVVAERYELTTRVVRYGRGGQYNGFVGTCQYRVLGSADRDLRRGVNLLADFALFAGTGQKTTQGLGQTRRVQPRG